MGEENKAIIAFQYWECSVRFMEVATAVNSWNTSAISAQELTRTPSGQRYGAERHYNQLAPFIANSCWETPPDKNYADLYEREMPSAEGGCAFDERDSAPRGARSRAVLLRCESRRIHGMSIRNVP